MILNGEGGDPGKPHYLLRSTNVASLEEDWTRVATNQFDPAGNFTVTNTPAAGTDQSFYRLVQP